MVDDLFLVLQQLHYSSNLLATFLQVGLFLWSEIIFVLVLQYFIVLGNVGCLANLL